MLRQQMRQNKWQQNKISSFIYKNWTSLTKPLRSPDFIVYDVYCQYVKVLPGNVEIICSEKSIIAVLSKCQECINA